MSSKEQLQANNELYSSLIEMLRGKAAGGADVSGVTATADDVVEGTKIVTANGELVDGKIPKKSSSNLTRTQNKIIVPKGYYPDGAEGFIPTLGEKIYTVSLDHPIVNVDVGYHDDTIAQIKREREKTVTPSNVDQTITPASDYVLSTVKVLGDTNLVAGNIKKGVSIFGVTGTYIGDIAACTVNIKWSVTTNYALITATTFANGTISRFVSKTGSGTVTIPNVVCGSVITVYTGKSTSVYGWSYGKEYSWDSFTHALTIPTSAGTYTAEIGVLDD